MGHYDDDGLAAALTLPNADVALVASVRRSAAVFEMLRSRGVAEEQLARVRAPRHTPCGSAGGDRVARARRNRRAPPRADDGQPAPQPAAIAGFEVDPVCGMTVDTAGAAHTAVHNGETYFFCCAGCQERFVADPAQFLRAPAG